MLTCDCTAAAEGTDYEADDLDASLKTIKLKLKLCSTVIHEISNDDMIN